MIASFPGRRIAALEELRLDGDDVHVWLANLECADPTRDRLLSTLSAEERARMDRFVFDRDRRDTAGSAARAVPAAEPTAPVLFRF